MTITTVTNDDDDDESDNNNEDNDDDHDDDDGGKDEDHDNNEHNNPTAIDDNDDHVPEINIADTVTSTPPATPPRSAGVGGETTGVGSEDRDTCARNTGVGSDDVSEQPDRDDDNNQIAQTMDERYGTRQHNINLRERKPRNYNHLYDSDHHLLATFKEPMGELFMTEQMSLKRD
jgi:hypothetical protein